MTPPLWLSASLMMEGITEIPGAASNPIILRWGRDIGVPAGSLPNDDVAWCAVYANRLCQALRLPLSGRGYDLLRAQSFSKWGLHLPYESLGSWMVFYRPGGGHVGLYVGEDNTRYAVHGGNTVNKVGLAWIEKTRLIERRWPLGVPLPQSGTVVLNGGGQATSDNQA